jgi:hypothetical protein
MKKLLTIGMVFLYPALVHATLINGGFETGNFTGWSTIGDALVINSSFGTVPPQGSFQALVSNAPSSNVFNVNPVNLTPFSGTNGVFPLDAAPFFGALSPSDWAMLVGHFDNSGIKQSFTTSGGFLTFTWNYLTDECCSVEEAFLVLDGALHLLTVGLLTLSPSATIFFDQTGYQTTSIFVGPGTHTVGFVIGETGDPDIMSALLIDKVFIASEGPAWLLFTLGLITFAAASFVSSTISNNRR